MGKFTVALLFLLPFLAIVLSPACGGQGSPTLVLPAQTEPPARDLMDLARRFRNLSADAPRLARLTPYAQQVGDSQQFTLIDLEAPATLRISATLQLITDHAYFFVQDVISVLPSALEA